MSCEPIRTVRSRNVLGGRDALQRGSIGPAGNLLLGEAFGPLGENKTRGNSVDADVRSAGLGHVLGEVDAADLGDGCGSLTRTSQWVDIVS